MAEVKRITIGFILGWILGVGALLTGISQLGIAPVRGVISLLIAAVLIPPASKFLETKSKVSLSGGVKVLVVIVLAVIASAVDSNGSGSATISTSSTAQQSQSVAKVNPSANTPLAVVPPREPSYQKIFTFSGNGAKKSEPFTVTGSRFKIKYDCKGSLCQAFLKKVAGEEWDIKLVMNTTENIKDESIFYGAGEYYIDANTIGSYTMTVDDYK